MEIRNLIALGFGLAGFVFFLQGLGLTDFFYSFMNHDIRWSLAGIGLLIAALLLWQRKP